jgi:hypothetical protein
MRAAWLAGLSVALAVLHTWPLASNLSGWSRLDNADTALNAWIITWVPHALVSQPLALFEAPIFHPEAHTLAYSEHLFVPSVMGAPLTWLAVSPVVVYNVLAIAGYAMSAWAMTMVVAAWTGSTAGGIVAGMLFAFNAHLLTRFPHLQALHVEFLPVTLFAFDRVLTLGRRRDAALLTGAFVLQSLCSNYTMVFLGAALLAAAMVRRGEWAAPGRRAVLIRLIAAAAASAALLAPFLWPYYLVSRDQGLMRSLDEVALYSAGWRDYLTTGGRLHYAWWSRHFFEGRVALFPGVAAAVLAVWAFAQPAVRRDPRIRMTLAFGVLGVVLSFGPSLPGYALLHAYVPPLQGLRAAARWGFLALIAVAILAGYGVAAIASRLGASKWRAAVMIAIAAIITAEALRAPMSFSTFAGIPAIYTRLAAEPGAVVADYPLYYANRVARNSTAMLGNTQYLRPMVNGYSGFEPATFVERARRLRAFPAAEAVAELRQIGVSHIVLREEEFVETEGVERLREVERSPDLALLAEVDRMRLYRLR